MEGIAEHPRELTSKRTSELTGEITRELRRELPNTQGSSRENPRELTSKRTAELTGELTREFIMQGTQEGNLEGIAQHSREFTRELEGIDEQTH